MKYAKEKKTFNCLFTEMDKKGEDSIAFPYIRDLINSENHRVIGA